MNALSSRDLRLALGFVHDLPDAADLDAFATQLLRDLPGLVACDIVGLNEVSPALKRIHSWTSPTIDNLRDFEQTWMLHQHEHPAYQHILKTGDGSAHRVSDFLSRDAFYRTGMYAECYRPIDCNAQISVSLDVPAGVVVALAFNRRRGDFSERDKQLLNLLRPHLSRACVRVQELSALKAHSVAADIALEALDEGLLALDSRGAVAWSTTRARELLLTYAGPNRGKDLLPAAVRNWADQLRHQPAMSLSPLALKRGDRSLTIRPLPGGPHGALVLRLKEHLPLPMSADVFRRLLGLTAREAEVMLAIVHGQTTPEIATTLGCRPRTAQKHTENLFRKLKVTTRTAAVTTALRALHDRSMGHN